MFISSTRGDDFRNGAVPSGRYGRIRNGRRATSGGFPEEKGRRDFDLGAARRSSYMGKSEGFPKRW